MPHKLRKMRRKRGTRTVGWGRVGQHRKSGQKGKRRVGRRKHLKSYVLRYEPDYFSKKGFSSLRQKQANVINVGELEDLVTKISAGEGLKEKNGMNFLDLDKLGYRKLLGKGNLTRPLSIKIASYSKLAATKTADKGGKLIQ